MARKQELSSNMEDYLEAILQIIEEKGEARSKEIMERMGVTGPSVTEAFQQLAERKLINYVPYEAITLTAEGEEIARGVLSRHVALRSFFSNILHIDYETADDGACKMEHVVSQKIINRMVLYSDYLKEQGEDGGFFRFLEEGSVK